MAIEHAQPGEVVDLNTLGEGKSTAVVKTDRFEVVRLVVDAGGKIPPHKVDGPITVQCLQGAVTFTSGDESRELKPGNWLHLAGDTLHAIEAHQPSVLLVTILFT